MKGIKQRKHYVLGFVFCEDKILLIQDQQSFDHLRGDAKEGELSPYHSMVRVFNEVTKSPRLEWDKFAVLVSETEKIHCFKCKLVYHNIKHEDNPAMTWMNVRDYLSSTYEMSWVAALALKGTASLVTAEYYNKK
jgi:hypothetical protein